MEGDLKPHLPAMIQGRMKQNIQRDQYKGLSARRSSLHTTPEHHSASGSVWPTGRMLRVQRTAHDARVLRFRDRSRVMQGRQQAAAAKQLRTEKALNRMTLQRNICLLAQLQPAWSCT